MFMGGGDYLSTGDRSLICEIEYFLVKKKSNNELHNQSFVTESSGHKPTHFFNRFSSSNTYNSITIEEI